MRLNYNDMLLLAIWEYNRRQDEDLTQIGRAHV